MESAMASIVVWQPSTSAFHCEDFFRPFDDHSLRAHILRATLPFQPTCCGRTGDRPREGLVLSWLLLAVLGIIWAAFLLPSLRRSPTSPLEEFEDKMNVLAGTNKVPSRAGRGGLMPRQGPRFLGPQDRQP